MRRLGKWLAIISGALGVLVILLLLFAQTTYVKSQVLAYAESYALKADNLRIEAKSLNYSLYPLTITVNGPRLYGGQSNDKTFLAANYLRIKLPYSSLWGKDFIVYSLELNTPSAEPANIPPYRSSKKSSGKFEIQRIILSGGALTYSNFHVQDVKMDARLNTDEFLLKSLDARLEDIHVTASGELHNFQKPTYNISYHLNGNADAISRLFPQVPPLTGTIDSSGKANGASGNYQAQGKLTADGMTVKKSSPFSVNADYKVDSANPAPYQVHLVWKDLPGSIARSFVPDALAVASVTNGNLDYEGPKDYWSGAGSFQAVFIPVKSSGIPLAANLSGTLAGGSLHLHQSNLSIGSSRVQASGKLNAASLQMTVHASIPRPAELAAFTPQARKIPGSYSIDSTLQGPYKNIQVTAALQGGMQNLALQANGTYSMGTKVVNATMSANGDAVAMNQFYPAGLQGPIRVEASASGVITHPNVQATIQGQSMVARGTKVGNLNINAQSNGTTLTANATLPDYATSATATYVFNTKQYSLQTRFTNLKMEQVAAVVPGVQGITGNISANLQASGNILQWKNSQAQLFIENAAFQRGQLKASIQNGSTIRVDHRMIQANVRTTLPKGALQVTGSLPMSAAKSGVALRAVGQGDLSALALVTDQVIGTGVVRLDVQVRGSLSHPQYAGSISSEQFSVSMPAKKIQLANGKLQAQFNQQQAAIQTTADLNGSPLKLNGVIPFANAPGNIQLSLQALPISTIFASPNVSGTIQVQLNAKGTGMKPANWSGDLVMTPSKLLVKDQQINTDPIRVHMTMGAAELRTLHVRAGNLIDMTAAGRVNFQSGELSARVQGISDLVLLTTVTEDAQASGKVNMDVNVNGTLSRPSMQGTVRITNGFIRVPDSPVLLESIDLVAALQSQGVTIEKFNAKMGGGNITGGGTIGLGSGGSPTINTWLKAEKVGLNYPQDLRSQTNADLKFTTQGEQFLLSGDIAILHSAYQDDIDPQKRLVTTLLNQKESLASAESSVRSRLKLDLHVRSLEDFQMRNNLGKLQAAADLTITGSLVEPRISGRLRVREGSRITFQNNEFEVRRGTVDFYGERQINPVLDIELYTIATDQDTKQEYDITIPLSGPADKLDKRDPESTPALDPNQIYYLLLTGRVNAQLSQAGSQFFQQQLASYISGQMFSDLQKNLAQAFGLQRVEIQPELVSSETTPGAKLVLGKDFNKSLSLVYAMSLTQSREQTWIANYRLTRTMDVRFVDQADGSYTANIRQQLRFGTGQSLSALYRNRPRLPHDKIQAINVTNNSPLSENQIQSRFNFGVGDNYDYWKLRDTIGYLKLDLQNLGYLFPPITYEETNPKPGSVITSINIHTGNKSSMIFGGGQPDKNQLKRYSSWWREGFSEQGVMQLISDDLRKGYWLKGYHQAEVTYRVDQQSGATQYHFDVKPGKLYSRPEIIFNGTQNYLAKDVGKDLKDFYRSGPEMATEAIHEFSAFKNKVIALYVKKGYLDAQVTSAAPVFLNDGRVQRHVVISEGSQSRIANIETAGAEFPAELQTKLKMKVGAVYDQQALAQDALAIQDYFESKGYRKFDMDTDITKNGTDLTLTYHLRPGGIAKVTSINVSGLQNTSRDLVLKRLGFKEGDVLTHDKLANAQKNLYDLRIFYQATVQAKESDVPNQYDVNVELVEMRHYELTYGLRYDTEQQFGGEVQIADLNLFGTGQGLSAYTRLFRSNQLYRMVYHSPTLAGLQWKNLVTASYENGDLLLRETNTEGLANGQRTLFQYQRQRTLKHPFLWITGVEFEQLHTRPINIPQAPFDHFKITRLVSTVLADTRDDPVNAHHGRFVSIDLQYSPTYLGSDVNYVKNFSQYFQFKPIGKKLLWASAYRVGISSSLDEHLITERFLAGGSYTIRGFGQDQVGPKDVFGNPIGGEAMIIINEELRYSMWKWFGGAVFYDGGNVYATYRDFNPLKLRHSLGVGLRVTSPFGVARFDVGWNISPMDREPRIVYHFALGQAF